MQRSPEWRALGDDFRVRLAAPARAIYKTGIHSRTSCRWQSRQNTRVKEAQPAKAALIGKTIYSYLEFHLSMQKASFSPAEIREYAFRPRALPASLRIRVSTRIDRLPAAAFLLLAAAAIGRSAEPVTFPDVMVRQSKKAGDQRLVDRRADLVFDDVAQRLKVKAEREPLDIDYADVTKVIFEVTEHMRGHNEGAFWTAAAGSVVPGGALASEAVAAQHVKDYLCYLEVRQQDGSSEPYVIEVGKHSMEAVKAKMNAAFPGRTRDQPMIIGQKINRHQLKDLSSMHSVTVLKQPRPMPDVLPDKALVVVVEQTPSARSSGKGTQVKLHANDRVVAVNKQGTWAFAYLDPGEYLLVSQADNANGLRMTLEAGQEYYFLQNTLFSGFKGATSLARHSKELVLFEASGAYYSDWTRTGP